jgi:hypothetical protein
MTYDSGFKSRLSPKDFTPMPSSIRNSLPWIFEAFESDSTYIAKRMFGSDAAYIDGLVCLVAADRDPHVERLAGVHIARPPRCSHG